MPPPSNLRRIFMPQAQVRQFPGFGVVYPDGISGIKVVRTFTQAPTKIINADGSTSYKTPSPTIHELHGGGFAYADGSPVKIREHLEVLPPNMKEKALAWFDGDKKLAVQTDIPPLNLDEKERPEPVYVLSSDLPAEKGGVTEELDKKVKEIDVFAELLKAVKSIEQTVKEQGEQIVQLKKSPSVPRKLGKQSEIMKKKWADPEWRARREAKKNGKDAA
jgi:hypothetical protein